MKTPERIEVLWKEGFFKGAQSLSAVSNQIKAKWEANLPAPEVSNSLLRASFLARVGKRGKYKYVQKISPVSKRVASLEEELFSDDLVSKMGGAFKVEIEDLRLNFGESGTCTAFLLRKVLEKLIFLVLAHHKLEAKVEDKKISGRLIGLEAMIRVASQEKIGGIAAITPGTARSIQGIKFLGDTAAHNPLINVDMKMIVPQMPYIITAYKELAERL